MAAATAANDLAGASPGIRLDLDHQRYGIGPASVRMIGAETKGLQYAGGFIQLSYA